MRFGVLKVFVLCLIPFFCKAQIVFDDDDKKANEKQIREWGSENIRNYFSITGGLSIPTGNFGSTELSVTEQSGYARTGSFIGGGLHYYLFNTIGIIGSFRYSSFGFDSEVYAEQVDRDLRLVLSLQGVNPSTLPPTNVTVGDYEMYNFSIGSSIRTPTIESMDFEFGIKLTYTRINFPRREIENQFFVPIVLDFVPKSAFTAEPFGRFHIRMGDNIGAFLHASYNGIESETEYSPKTQPAGVTGEKFPLDMKNTTLGLGLSFIFG